MRGATLIGAAVLLAASVAQAQLVPLDQQTEASSAWPVKTSLIGEFRTLLVDDDTNQNNSSLTYLVRARGDVLPSLMLMFGVGLTQRFVAEDDDSAFRLTDTQLGVGWSTPVKFSDDYTLSLVHFGLVFLPSSRASAAQDLIVAPMYQLRAVMEVVSGLSVGVNSHFRYRFHKYAERAGLGGDMNTQLDLGVRGGLDYNILDSKRFGGLSAGVSAGTTYGRSYASRDTHESASSDAAAWAQVYDWEAHLVYSPLNFVFLSLGLEQGASVLRDGVVNLVPFHRDETEWTATVGVTL